MRPSGSERPFRYPDEWHEAAWRNVARVNEQLDDVLGTHEEIMELSSVIAAAQARILELLTTHGDLLAGGDDLATWLSWVAGMKRATAKRHLRPAERLCELPKIKESFSKGEISFEKTETIAKAAPDTQEQLVMWAQNGLCSQLATIASGLRRTKVSLEEANANHRDRYLDYHYTDEGGFRLRARIPAEQGALVARAIEAAEEMLYQERQTFSDHDLGAVAQRVATDIDTWSHWIDPCNFSDAIDYLCDNDPRYRALEEAQDARLAEKRAARSAEVRAGPV